MQKHFITHFLDISRRYLDLPLRSALAANHWRISVTRKTGGVANIFRILPMMLIACATSVSAMTVEELEDFHERGGVVPRDSRRTIGQQADAASHRTDHRPLATTAMDTLVRDGDSEVQVQQAALNEQGNGG